MSNRKPPTLPKEEEAIPLEPSIAKARVKYVKETLAKIEEQKRQGKSEDEIKESFSKFSEEYPTLFKMVLRKSIHDPSLQTMLFMLEKMGTGAVTQHQASGVVGTQLYNTYIKPNLDSNKE